MTLISKLMRVAGKLMAALALLVSATYPAMAQSNQNAGEAIGQLFGALIQAGAKSNAQRGWGKISPQVKQCLNLMLTSTNVTVDQLAEAGIAPSDQRVTPAIEACNKYLTTKTRSNFPCAVTNSKGQQVASTCNESYAKEVNGSLVAISGEEMLIAASHGEKILAANFETQAAKEARLAEEARAAKVDEKPRGYELICMGVPASSDINTVRVDCNNASSALNSLIWAHDKIVTAAKFPGQERRARDCFTQIEQLRSMINNSIYTGPIGDISRFNFMAVCNLGLLYAVGPAKSD